MASLAVLASAVAVPVAAGQSHTKARTFSFYARVVRSSSRGLEVRTLDGRKLWFSASQIRQAGHPKPVCRKRHGAHKGHKCTRRHKGARGRLAHAGIDSAGRSITINIQGLQPGVTILITESVDSDGNVTITITLPPPAGEQSASGVVGSVETDAFGVQEPDGSALRLHMAPDALAALNLQSCNTVDVAYHQHAGLLIADKVVVTGTSASGDCTPTEDARGTITTVSATNLTIKTDDGSPTFAVGTLDVSGFKPGDVVDVTYTKADDGTLNATDVEYVEETASGTATDVSASKLTLTGDDGGQSQTFVAGKGMQVQTDAFDGVHKGDHVSVGYHVSGGALVADCVQVSPPPADGQNGGDGSSSGSGGQTSGS
jgi:hypothetical protein